MSNQNVMRDADWELIISKLERQLAEAQQARDAALADIKEYHDEQWCFHERHVLRDFYDNAIKERDTLRGLLRSVLKDHWLSGIHCNHEKGTDESSCACGRFICTPQQSVGDAVQRWIEHVDECITVAAEGGRMSERPGAMH